MELNAFTVALTAFLGIVSLVVGAVIASMKMMWTKLGECETHHEKCQADRLADLLAMNALTVTVKLQQDQLDELKERDKAEVKAIVALTGQLQRIHPGVFHREEDVRAIETVAKIATNAPMDGQPAP